MRASVIAWAAVLTVVEAATLALAATWPAVGRATGLIHAGCALAMLPAIRGRSARPGGAAVWVACALGPAGILVVFAAQRMLRGRRFTLPLAGTTAQAGESERAPITATRILDERVRHCDADRLGSLTRVFRRGTTSDRQAAIEAVISRFEPRLTPIIALALADRDQTIRALAASASTQIAQRLARRKAHLEVAIAHGGQIADQIVLADLLAAHGRHDVLLSDTQRERISNQARVLFRATLDGLASDDPAYVKIVERLHALEPEDAVTSLDALPLAAACDRLWRARDFAGLARRCAMPDALALRTGDPLHAAAAFWREAAAA